MIKNKSSDRIGDAIYKNKNIEIKVSLGTHNFNYVQIRLDHNIQYYLFTAYVKSEDKLFKFMIPKDIIKEIVMKYGHYAHGTIKALGPVRTSIEKPKIEFALRPKYKSKCWNELMKYNCKNELLIN